MEFNTGLEQESGITSMESIHEHIGKQFFLLKCFFKVISWHYGRQQNASIQTSLSYSLSPLP